MRTNRNILSALAILVTLIFSVQSAKAQTSDNATLNIHLKPIFSIEVDNDKTINLTYETESDYTDGVSYTSTDHLKINSTAGFQIKVKSEGFTNGTGVDLTTIEASTVKLTAAQGSKAVSGANYEADVVLDATDKTLASSTSTGGLGKTVNVTYAGAGNEAYIDKYKGGSSLATTTYTGTVTYTIVAQ